MICKSCGKEMDFICEHTGGYLSAEEYVCACGTMCFRWENGECSWDKDGERL